MIRRQCLLLAGVTAGEDTAAAVVAVTVPDHPPPAVGQRGQLTDLHCRPGAPPTEQHARHPAHHHRVHNAAARHLHAESGTNTTFIRQ